MKLFLDTETRCATPLAHGTHRYAEDVEVFMWQWAIGGGPVKVEERLSPELIAAIDLADRIVMHNSTFDRTVIRHATGIAIPPEKIEDTMVQAMSHGLPGSLDKLCEIMKVDNAKAKSKAGKALIQLFCKPRPDGSWATKYTHPIEWQRFLDYGASDITAMRDIYLKLPRFNYPAEREHRLWCLDQRINDRGMCVDQRLAEAALRVSEKSKRLLNKRTQEMTDDELRSTTQRDELLRIVLEEYGVELPDLKKDTLERRLEDPDLPEGVKELIRIRLQVSTTSTSKYTALLRAVSSDGRLRGTLQFSGAARTKRWSGRIFQPQNMMRPDREFEKQEYFEAAVASILGEYTHLIYDEPIRVCANAVRGSIIAPPEKKLVISDLEQIEARVLPWLAGESWKLDAFAQYDLGIGYDNYVMAYSRAFNVDPAVVDKILRQVGKVSELSCGYGGAYGAWVSMAAVYRIDIPPRHEVQAIINAWRAAHPALCDWDTGFWAKLDQAARLATMNPGKTYSAGKHIRFERWKEWLKMELPSGGFLTYAAPAIVEDPRRPGRDSLSYMGVNNYTKKWERLYTYGGKLSADATQATAREIMGHNLPAIEAAGYAPILLVHDEVVTETPDDPGYSADRLNSMLAANPPWAADLPMAAGGFETYRYRKD